MDIIARDGRTLVFVEVKARRSRAFGEPAEAVGPLKRLRITRLALGYLASERLAGCPCRFDVVSVRLDRDRATIEVFQNAFDGSP